MDKVFFIKKILTQLGLPALSMEKYYPSLDEIFQKDTLNTFSQFFPYTYLYKLKLSEAPHSHGDGTWEVYYARDRYLEDNHLDILSIQLINGKSSFEQYNSTLQTFNVDAMLLEGIAAGIRSQLNISTKSFKFLPPNRIALKGFGSHEEVMLAAKVPYANYGTISPSVSVEFEKLAKLDAKLWLYPELRMYTHLTTAEGEIDLHIDDWADAEKDRESLIDEWRNKNLPLTIGYHDYTLE